MKQLEGRRSDAVFYTAAGRREPIVASLGSSSSTSSRTAAQRIQRGGRHRPATFAAARWVADPSAKFTLVDKGAIASDRLDRRVILFSSPWELEYFGRQHPNVELLAESPQLVS